MAKTSTQLLKLQMIQQDVIKHHLDGYLISDLVDIQYLLNVKVSSGFLLVTPSQMLFFVDSRYFDALQHLEIEVVLSRIEPDPLYEKLKQLKKVGFDQKISYLEYAKFAKYTEMVPFSSFVSPLRSIKTQEEIQSLTSAAKLCQQGFDFAITQLKEGVTEKQIAQAVEIFWLQHQGEGLAFEPIVAFGQNSAYPHHRASETTLSKQQVVLLDMGVVYQGQCADLTRVYYFGKAPASVKQIYSTLHSVLQEAISKACEKVDAQNLDREAKKKLKEAGLKAYTHSLGHGLGLEVHEPPLLSEKISQPLSSDMVVTIEPGVYDPNNFGMRLEQMVHIGKKTPHLLSPQIPSQIPEL